MKILLLKPSSLGDVIQAIPVLRLLKGHYSSAEIYWWIDTPLAPLLEGDADLAGVVRFERKRWSRPPHWPEMLQSVRWLRGQNFDLVIDLQCLARSGVFAWLSKGDLLVGLDEVREGARGFYDLVAPRKHFHTHAVDWYQSVLPLLGVPVHKNFVWLPEHPEIAGAATRKWPTFFEPHSRSGSGPQLITIQPGARWLNKRWPANHFAELVRALAERFPATRFALLGDKGDQPLGEQIRQAAPGRCLNLCGATSLPEMIEWVRLGDLLITNDTGPMHVAAALGKPLVALFGPTAPERTGPYGQLENVLRLDLPCAPCLRAKCHLAQPEACLRGLLPATVLAHAEKLLSSRA